VHAVQTPVLRKAWLRPGRLMRLVSQSPGALARLRGVIRELDPDVVFVNTVTLPHWVLAARLARRRVVVHVHEAEEAVSRWLRAALYLPLLLAHIVIANSNTTGRVVGSAAGRLRTRTRVVHNGVPDRGAQPRSHVVPGRLTVVSRLSPRKGVREAIDALALLVAAGRDVTLEICGTVFVGYEWFEAQLHQSIRQAGLTDRVIFSGFVSPVETALARAEIVVAPSYGESFGNSAVEAMLAERPVVASDVQGLAEIVEHGRTGLLTRPGEPASIAAAVGELLDDPDRATRLAASARADSVQRFAPEGYGAALRTAVLEAVPAPAYQRKTKARLKIAWIVALEISSSANICRGSAYRLFGRRAGGGGRDR
jgi:glycosyltransferase involved in cell wall biosynthesis